MLSVGVRAARNEDRLDAEGFAESARERLHSERLGRVVSHLDYGDLRLILASA